MNWKDEFPNEDRYFETENGILYCGDSNNILKKIPDNKIDLILTDPPYGILEGNKIGGDKFTKVNEYNCSWDSERLSQDLLNEIFRISKNQIIFGYNYIADLLPITNSIIVWDKKCKNNWFDNFSDGELIWTSFKKPLRIFRYLWMGAIREGKRIERFHPTQKPVELIDWILNFYLKNEINDINLICDPFLGSGTTAISCEKMNKKWIGIEMSEDFCNKTKNRLKKEISVLNSDSMW